MRRHLDAAGRRIHEGDIVMATIPGKTTQVWCRIEGFTPKKIWCVLLERALASEQAGRKIPSAAYILRYAEQIVLVRTGDGLPLETRDHDYVHNPEPIN